MQKITQKSMEILKQFVLPLRIFMPYINANINIVLSSIEDISANVHAIIKMIQSKLDTAFNLETFLQNVRANTHVHMTYFF